MNEALATLEQRLEDLQHIREELGVRLKEAEASLETVNLRIDHNDERIQQVEQAIDLVSTN